MYYIVYVLLYLLSLAANARFIRDSRWHLFFVCIIVFRYRIKVVMDNLLIAFPEKTQAEELKSPKNFI